MCKKQTIKKVTKCTEACTNEAADGNLLLTNLFEKERPQSVRIFQTFLQLTKEETRKLERSDLESVWGKVSSPCVSVCVRVSYSLCQS